MPTGLLCKKTRRRDVSHLSRVQRPHALQEWSHCLTPAQLIQPSVLSAFHALPQRVCITALLRSRLIHTGPGGEPERVLDTTANPLIHPPIAACRATETHAAVAFMRRVFPTECLKRTECANGGC